MFFILIATKCQLAQSHKGKKSERLSRVFWRHHIWAHGYFVAGSGNVTDEVITKYIEEQVKVPHYGVFKVND